MSTVSARPNTAPATPTRWNPREPERWATRRTQTGSLFALADAAPARERPATLSQIVVNHLDLAETIARRYTGRSQDAEDLRQVAYVGLVKAAQRFDATKGGDFVSFAVPTISGEIKRHLRDHGWFIRPPRQIQELRIRINGMLPGLTQQLGRAPSTDELATALEEDRRVVEEAMNAHESLHPASLDVTFGEDDGMSLGETLGVADASLDRAELLATLAPAVSGLTAREQRIVYLRYFEEKTQQEIAQELGVTQMQISRLLRNILGALRGALAMGQGGKAVRAAAATRSRRRTGQPRSA